MRIHHTTGDLACIQGRLTAEWGLHLFSTLTCQTTNVSQLMTAEWYAVVCTHFGKIQFIKYWFEKTFLFMFGYQNI